LKAVKFAIVGCGLIGRKRLATLPAGAFVIACDVQLDRAEALVELAGVGSSTASIDEALATDCDAVIVATLNSTLAPLAARAICAGKHVLIEKPAGVSVQEIRELEALAAEKRVCVRVGYNHRFHPAFQKAREIVDSGVLGKLMFIRGRYGHGGRVGYDREWRADPRLSGGGELIDQGVHLIDLSGWFLGKFTSITGHADTLYWDMPVDDNAFLDLRTAWGQTAWLQVSCSEWKNLFSFEIYGRDGKLHVEGLGGSYGVERLSHYRMLPKMGPPETVIYEYPGADTSWALEMNEFLRDIETQRTPEPGLKEAREALEIVEAIYRK
jgi:predicted dehydrogenase